ncbi:uncharacterized protein LOC117523984 [Thalassophryne amazonica]|uniref:uncharacterized protein LOC117523984 n=1 Tax=Thalassophryne amazonica TaxID=390379 RepID=UPI001471C67C|nr:uncharacterized protein LOC117523984 [Thalassophryne amazonica]
MLGSCSVLLLLFVGCHSLSNAENRLHCNVTQTNGGTLYSIPEFHASDCKYFWTNSTDHVLANNLEQLPGVVQQHTDHSLRTTGCINVITYTRDCVSEGVKKMASCFIDCAADSQNLTVQPYMMNSTTTVITTVSTRDGGLTSVQIVLSVLLLVLFVAGVICGLIWRKKISRYCTRMMENIKQNPMVRYKVAHQNEQEQNVGENFPNEVVISS